MSDRRRRPGSCGYPMMDEAATDLMTALTALGFDLCAARWRRVNGDERLSLTFVKVKGGGRLVVRCVTGRRARR